MRVTRHGWVGLVLLLQTSGCAAVLDAAAENPAAIALLPVAAVVEVIGAAAKENKKPSTGMVSFSVPPAQPDPLAYRNWSDPDDWVASCDGPMLCPEHEHFACAGTPDDCYCDCVGSLVSRAGATNPRQGSRPAR